MRVLSSADAWDIATFFASSLITSVYIAVAVRGSCRHGVGRFARDAAAWLVARTAAARTQLMRGASMSKGQAPTEEKTMNALARKEFKQWQLVKVREGIRLTCMVTTYFNMAKLMNLALGLSRWMTPTQDVACLVIYFFIVLFDTMPHLITRWTCAFIHTVFMLSVMLFVSPLGVDPSFVPMISSFTTLPRLLTVAMIDKTWIYLFWHSMISSVAICSYSQYASAHPDQHFPMRAYMSLEVMGCVLSTGVFRMIVQTKRADLRHGIEAAARRRERSALTTLLETTTDVVVELDEALGICDNNPKLSSILSHGPDDSLKGSKLHEFMPSTEDRDRYLEQMGASTGNESFMAQVMHAHMQDDQANETKFQLFHVKFDSVDGQVRHLIGMREFPDVPGIACLPSETRAAKPPGFREPSALAPPGPGTPREAPRESLGPRPASERSSRSSHRDVRLALPALRRTDYTSKMFQVATMLMSWNFSVTHSHCCLFHSALGELRKVISTMNMESCKPDYKPMSAWQCPHCGLLDLDDSEADPRTQQCLTCKSLGRTNAPEPPEAAAEPKQAVAGPKRSALASL